MTDNMKCPICGKDLIEIGFGKRWFLACDNSKCRCKGVASYVVWEHIDRTRKALGIAINAMKSAGTHNSINCIVRGEDPSKDDVGITINRALNKITALEQKEQE